ncbi:MAG: rod shape-determining protein MreD [Planctomycetaceae bacterium]|nr:rod shape-determining protein MreD [Planctomycetaceae bacterium]
MKWLRFSLLILATTVIGSSALMDVISLTEQHIKPNLLLIMLVYFAINCNSYDAIICCFSIGLAADLTGTLIGPYFLSYGIIGTALAQVRKFIILKTTTQQALAIFVTGVVIHLVAVILMKFKMSDATVAGFSVTFTASIYSAILWFLLKMPVQALGKWLGVGVYRFGNRVEERI